ncbi:MAG: ATP-binding cassette domain-containing protein [Holosporaceae bacterium]|jgi:putative ABC transport system ATP-binding protein|nr:ATP-binding cassette domain-containing protein [Holosporaceae bacterium]
MIRLEDVFIVFCPNTPLERVALRGINMTVNSGEIVTLVGNNGCGRSTLLRFLAGHLRASVGRLWFDKVDISCQTLSERSQLFSSVFYEEDVGSAGNLTVLENLVIASLHHQRRSILAPAISPEAREMFMEQLQNMNFMRIEALADERAGNIPKPHRQVLAMMIAVIKGAKVLLIDEHSTGLDQDSAIALLEATEKIVRSNHMTTIMAVSDPKFSLGVSDRTIVLSHGQVVSNLSGYDKQKTSIGDIFNKDTSSSHYAFSSQNVLSSSSSSLSESSSSSDSPLLFSNVPLSAAPDAPSSLSDVISTSSSNLPIVIERH